MSVAGASIFHYSNSIPDVKFLDNLIGWMLTDAGKVMLELNLSQLQCCSNARDAMLVPVLHVYCEPTLTLHMYYNVYIIIAVERSKVSPWLIPFGFDVFL